MTANQVAFSASLYAPGSIGKPHGPFPEDKVLIYKNVVCNIGNAYNVDTGKFTAPVKGAYRFDFSANVGGSPTSSGSDVGLVMNGKAIFQAGERQSDGWGNAGNAVILELEAGHQVHMQLFREFQVWDSDYHVTTFTGHLLFPM